MIVLYGREAFALQAEGLIPEGCRNRAEWAGMMAAEIKKQACPA